jgi:hypothetical protein
VEFAEDSMRFWPIAATALLASAVAIGLVIPCDANDSTIPCNGPPDKGAYVAVHAGTQVVTTQSKQDQTCTLAINGAVATSPPPQDVINALNTFHDPTRRFLREDERTISALAILLVSPAPVKEVPKEVIQLLTNFRPRLMSCLASFFDGKLPEDRSDAPRFACAGFQPYTNSESKAAMLRSTGVAVGEPTLAISLEWGDHRFVSTAWLPLIITELPPLRLP